MASFSSLALFDPSNSSCNLSGIIVVVLKFRLKYNYFGNKQDINRNILKKDEKKEEQSENHSSQTTIMKKKLQRKHKANQGHTQGT